MTGAIVMDTYPQTHLAAVEARGEQSSGASPTQTPTPSIQRQSTPTATPAPRRTKTDALRIASRLKRGTAIAAMLGFSVFGVTIGSHLAATSATTTAHTTTSSSKTSSNSSTSSSSSSGG